jgi:hypothetical protein
VLGSARAKNDTGDSDLEWCGHGKNTSCFFLGRVTAFDRTWLDFSLPDEDSDNLNPSLGLPSPSNTPPPPISRPSKPRPTSPDRPPEKTLGVLSVTESSELLLLLSGGSGGVVAGVLFGTARNDLDSLYGGGGRKTWTSGLGVLGMHL